MILAVFKQLSYYLEAVLTLIWLFYCIHLVTIGVAREYSPSITGDMVSFLIFS